MRSFISIPLTCLLLLACDTDGDDGMTTVAGSTSDPGSDSNDNDNDNDNTTTSGASDATSGQASQSSTDPTADSQGSSSSSGTVPDSTTSGDGSEESSGGSSTGEPPTSGPGVLPGESGQEAMCRRALECGSTYYDSAQACIDAGTNYWGSCAEVTAALDAFGACMSDIPCDEYNPDAYNPSSTPCADQWGDLQSAGPC